MRVIAHLAGLFLLGLILSAQADITLLPPKEARKQKTPPEPVPPEPVPVNINVRRGGTVEIPLRVFGVPGESFTYRLRTLPTAGKLSEPKMIGRGLGTVTYEHRNGNTQDHDQFSFATRTEHGISKAVEAHITIVDDPPVLNVQGELDFGMVAIGSTATRELTIENRGGGVLAGNMSVDGPWKLEGKDTYRLRSGEHQSIRLRFTAQSEQTSNGQLRFSSHPSYNAPLSAVAEAVISIAPDRLELLATAEPTRSGILTITNRTEAEQPLRIHISSKLSGPDRVTVPPHGQISVTITAMAGEIGPIDDGIEIYAPSFAAKIPVHAPAAGPNLLVSPVSLAFGKIDGGQTAKALLQVANTGGTRVLVRLESSPPVVLASRDATFWLEPGTLREVTVSLEQPAEGTFDGLLRIKTSGKETIVPISAEVTLSQPTVRLPRVVVPTHVDSAPASASAAKQFINASIKRITPTTCEIEWQPVAGQVQYKIASFPTTFDAQIANQPEGTSLSNVTILQKGGDVGKNLASHGVKLDDWSSGRDDGNAANANVPSSVVAVIKQLTPDSPYEFRVMAIDVAGVTIQASRSLQFRTVTWWQYAGFLRFLAPLLALLVSSIIWRSIRGGTPSPEPAKKSDPETKSRPAEVLARKPASAPKQIEKKFPMMREIEPGRFVIDLDEPD